MFGVSNEKTSSSLKFLKFLILTDFNKEIEAGYISFDFEVFSNAPDYIKQMAKDINAEYQKFFKRDFFKFVDETDIWGDDVPPEVEKIRKELEKSYGL